MAGKVELTKEEHRARAMLLGMVYWPMSHVYKTITPPTAFIDADTLEPVTKHQRVERYEIARARYNRDQADKRQAPPVRGDLD